MVGNRALVRRMSRETYMVRIYTGPLSQEHEFVSVEAEKVTTADDILKTACVKMLLHSVMDFELAEVFSTGGQLCKERRLEDGENPVRIQLLWPKIVNADHDRLSGGGYTGYRFYIRKKTLENPHRTSGWVEYNEPNPVNNFLTAFLKPPISNKEYSDLCNLPDLNERTLLDNIKSRFSNSNIYTYVGSILIAVNPFKFFPIYNPKYVKLYQSKRLGEMPPHIFAIADAAFYTMLRNKSNQCIVISGESGSGKTESTNLLLHHLTALSHKGLHGSGVEQTILGAGPVLEAFGNAKTVHNNNSSRFGKFIQVNYKENGMVHGAIVEKYLLEKSRIVSQAANERNYHVFYYLLEGADELERDKLHLGKPEDYAYLRQLDTTDKGNEEGLEEDEKTEFERLKHSMELVGFSQLTQKRIFGVLSAVLHLGNVTFKKKGDQHHDESVIITNPDTIAVVSRLLMVKEKTLVEALTQKKTVAGDETVVMTHRMDNAVAIRDAMAKCLYGALFDWIVLKVNQALLAKRHNSEHQEDDISMSFERNDLVRHTGNSIGVLDIFGFEDFRWNSFEQFCINYANEHLQYYFNQHIFKFEQEEYKKEGIQWKNIEFIDNTDCLALFSKKGNGLFALIDEECTFPGASNDTLLSKFHHHHAKGNVYYEAPQKKELAFTVVHYAGKVKYQIKDFREKNSDQIRTDIVANLKSSSLAFVRELMGVDPVAVLRWTIIKTLIKSVFAFVKAGKTYRKRGGPDEAMLQKRSHAKGDYLDNPDLESSHVLSSTHLSPSRPAHHKSPQHTPLHDARHGGYAGDSFCYDNTDEGAAFLGPKRHSGPLRSPVDPYLSEDEVKVMRRANRVMMKSKSFKPKSRPQTMFSDIKTLKAIAQRTMYIGGKGNNKQKPPSVGQQFQWSLSRLMYALNQANPFFIRCIKSNAEKLPCRFDDVLVLRQLRYTGMLATVRIRQSGYNYRLTFEEFVQMYKIILPNGLRSNQRDVATFLDNMNMNKDNYQIGITKVFLRETEKLYIDECLHRAIMKRVVFLQRWAKARWERKNYLQMRASAITLQKHMRTYLARRYVENVREAAVCIQKYYRGRVVRRQFIETRVSAIKIQAHVKGHLCRKRAIRRRYRELEEELRRQRAETEAGKLTEDMHSSASDEGVLVKDSSADELEQTSFYIRSYSEESSGIHDDSESETVSEAQSPEEVSSSPPSTPTSQRDMDSREEYLAQTGQGSRVQNLTKQFQSPVNDDVDGRMLRDSPTTSGPSPLSPDKYKNIEDALRKRAHTVSTEDVTQRSPFTRALKGAKQHLVVPQESFRVRETKSFPSGASGSPTLKRKMSFSATLLRKTKSSIKLWRESKTHSNRKKKDSTADDSEEEHDHDIAATLPRQSHPSRLGVSVLPHPSHPLSAKTPQQEISRSTEDLGVEKSKPIQKKRQTRKGDKDKENQPVKIGNKSRWEYPAEFVIKELWELKEFDKFIRAKVNELQKSSAKESQFDIVFMKCLNSFHNDLMGHLAVYSQDGMPPNFKYRDMFVNFENTMESICKVENVSQDFPVTICINAFRGYLDEFRNSASTRKKEAKSKKKQGRPKREKVKKDVIEHQGHKMTQVQFGIPTYCELCSSIIWIMEKGYVCQVCKYTCHRKCLPTTTALCRGTQDSDQRIVGTKVFCVPLQSLVTAEEKIPAFLDLLIRLIETHGIHTEGIYRKSGAAAKIKTLKMALDSGAIDINVDEFPVHVLTSTLKTFFRELPEPLLTFDLYDEFIQASEIKDEREAIQVLFTLTQKLPKVNHDVLERLIFHLARVIQHEPSNKMSANGIAIIFAPCLLRTNKAVQAQELLKQINKQQLCIEKILNEQVRKYRETLQDIKIIDQAKTTAEERLTKVRQSIRATQSKTNSKSKKDVESQPLEEDPESLEEQERVINSHIKSLRKEKEELTSGLPMFEYRHSSDDDIDDIDSTEDADLQSNDSPFDGPAKAPASLNKTVGDRTQLSSATPTSQITSQRRVSEGDVIELSDLSSLDLNQGQVQSPASGMLMSALSDRELAQAKKYVYVEEEHCDSDTGHMEQLKDMPVAYTVSVDERQLDALLDPVMSESALANVKNGSEHYRKHAKSLDTSVIGKKLMEKKKKPPTPMAFSGDPDLKPKSGEPPAQVLMRLTKPAQLSKDTKYSRLSLDIDHKTWNWRKELAERHAEPDSAIFGSPPSELTTIPSPSKSQRTVKSSRKRSLDCAHLNKSNSSLSLMDTSDSDDGEIMV
ncbi:unconventional myosin-IXa-like isoform X3 [Dreissena polymorpha]|uniref:unconventional myosin-IXa-like isoform X3 n=1 Tax=Dreissena polymorpha TaxID=45954 RepID=UPI002264A70B|nr:unconventional myosin-IXa-like isoform X3 [Dreissena polymorpha]